MKKTILFLLISSLLFSCEYDQDYYDLSVSVDNTSYYLSPSESTNWSSSSDPINITINGGASKALYYPVLINAQIFSYMDAVDAQLSVYDNCCLKGIYASGVDGSNDYDGDTEGIICNCEEDGSLLHVIQTEWTGTSYSHLSFYNTTNEYTLALIDPYVKSDGTRDGKALRRAPNNSNIICESEPFTFINTGGGLGVSWNCSNGNCYDPGNGNGQYLSLSACQSACGINSSWDCDGNGNCYDRGNGNGQYLTLSACQNNCVPPPPPNDQCNITSVSSSPYTTIITPTPNIFNFGDVITIEMYHPSYAYNQGSIALYKNEIFITYLGSGGWSNSQQTVTLPLSSQISASNCYTIRVTGSAGNPPYFNVSDPITIY